VNELRYKAYISYSHQDEHLAAWLHRALESYRVPRRLVESSGQFGAVPARLTPVFRDRDDLSSATDLSEKIKTALTESESLVVICSPAARQSRWVNEEIRQFRVLGRGERIVCVIVDGDPQSDDPALACFPPALLEDETGMLHEPLAADIRKWADGKTLAKLKLVAGILGIRLDELRQRDLHRKRKLQALAGLVVMAVLTLVLTAFQARVAEQEARHAQQRDRENAENMLSQFIEATESLDQVADLQTSRTFNEVASVFLQNLDLDDLSIESKRNLGRVLQDQGKINQAEGDHQRAMDLFIESREILNSIYEESPQDEVAIFDLGQVEFYLGYAHYSQGRFEEAGLAFSAYHDASEKLVEIDPGNADWVMEMAYALSNLGNIEKRRNPADLQNTLNLFKAALQNAELAARLNESWATELADFNADLADALMGICNLQEALAVRLKTAQYAEQHHEQDPGNNTLKMKYAFSLAGLASVQRQVGSVELALANLQQSIEVLSELYEGDRTRLQYRWNLFEKSYRAAYLMTLIGKTDEARVWYQQIENMAMALIRDDRDISLGHSIDYPDFLVHYAGAAFRWGEGEKAMQLLNEGTKRVKDILQKHPTEKAALEVLAHAEFYSWAHGGKGAPGAPPDPLLAEGSHGPQSCKELDFSARQALIAGDLERAREYSAVLHQKGFLEPEFMQICVDYNFCSE